MKASLRVTVLMGGPSAEHEISLKSGQGIVQALQNRCWHVEPLVIPRSLTAEEASAFVQQALRRNGPDVAFIALHGAFGEDGAVQRLCEELHVAYTGSDAAASRLGMDKVASRTRFETAGLSVPAWRLVELEAGTTLPHTEGLGYPLVVKPNRQGSSLGISVVHAPSALPAAMAAAREYGPQILLEEFVTGRELTVGILGEAALPVIEIRSQQPFFNYTAKYTAGQTEYLVPAPLPVEVASAVQAAAVTAHRALGCRHLSRADFILTPRSVPVLLEINTIPGFTPTSLLPKAAACAHLSYDELCERLVLMAGQDAAHLRVPVP